MVHQAYQSEMADLVHELVKLRTMLGSGGMGYRDPLFRQIDAALASWRLDQLRKAKSAVEIYLTQKDRRGLMGI